MANQQQVQINRKDLPKRPKADETDLRTPSGKKLPY